MLGRRVFLHGMSPKAIWSNTRVGQEAERNEGRVLYCGYKFQVQTKLRTGKPEQLHGLGAQGCPLLPGPGLGMMKVELENYQ